MQVVLGIGNPGARYAATRHNVGFRVLERLAARAGASFTGARFPALVATVGAGPERVLLVKPLTYVNLAGQAARAALDYYGLGPERLLAVLDDLHLPLGRLRLRAGGSAGGHNGLKNLAACLGTEDYTRLRVGIGGSRGDQVGHVLGRPTAGERAALAEAEERAADCCECWWREGLMAAANRYNPDAALAAPPADPDQPPGPAAADAPGEDPAG